MTHGPNTAAATASTVDWWAIAHLLALAGGSIAVLMVGLLGARAAQRVWAPGLAVLTLAVAADLTIRQWGEGTASTLHGALRVDDLSLAFDLILYAAGLAAIVLAWRSRTVREVGRGEFNSLVLAAVLGMALLASAQNLVTFFISFELFSIVLYALCAASMWRSASLEAGLKYLVVGSFGSATMLFGMAFVYGATGSTDFDAIGAAVASAEPGADALLMVGAALVIAGLAFKASMAPFHQWTPDVYEGAPTPITAFMAVATKAAAFVILLRFLGQALPAVRDDWAPVVAALAALTIAVGNLGAIAQNSLKRMLAYSGVAQAGYLAAGVVVGSELGARAVVFYLFAYLLMNVGAFAVIQARERAGAGESFAALTGLGRENPLLAWSMTLCMLSLAGLPITAGFVGKLFLIQASVDGGYTWLGVAIVVGSAISLAYYLRVIAAVWMAPGKSMRSAALDPDRATPLARAAGASPDADPTTHRELVAVAVLCAAATVAIGFAPSPLLDLARDAGAAFMALR